ncbi:hypothetical protein [Jiangella mangrovi]|uniref:DUF3558 domain-containing protein n=1 Tax=Jiangella mangrovi TaxID=1524084 RepID=A0A7W9LKE2_9ACTN|nr:hypothetical protein [Jiangella mangrovi]MBB5787090.1 hypothetical protein [Jiangella mangrovi]
MRVRSIAAFALVLAACGSGAGPAADTATAAKTGSEPSARRVCDLLDPAEVRAVYSGGEVRLSDYAGPVGDPSFESCYVTIDYGTTTRPPKPFPLMVSMDPVSAEEHLAMLEEDAEEGIGPRTVVPGLGDVAYIAPGLLHVYAGDRVVRIHGGGDDNAVDLAALVVPRLAELAPSPDPGSTQPACDAVTPEAEAVLGEPATGRRDRRTQDELRCEWTAGETVLTATLRGRGDEVGRVWAMDRPGAEVVHVGGLHDNGVYVPSGRVYFWMGHQQVGMLLRQRPHDPGRDRDHLVALADAFAPSLLDVAPRVGPAPTR